MIPKLHPKKTLPKRSQPQQPSGTTTTTVDTTKSSNKKENSVNTSVLRARTPQPQSNNNNMNQTTISTTSLPSPIQPPQKSEHGSAGRWTPDFGSRIVKQLRGSTAVSRRTPQPSTSKPQPPGLPTSAKRLMPLNHHASIQRLLHHRSTERSLDAQQHHDDATATATAPEVYVPELNDLISDGMLEELSRGSLLTAECVFQNLKMHLTKVNNLVVGLNTNRGPPMVSGVMSDNNQKVDMKYVHGLKDVIDVLLKDLQHQQQNTKKLENEDARKEGLIREIRDELYTLKINHDATLEKVSDLEYELEEAKMEIERLVSENATLKEDLANGRRRGVGGLALGTSNALASPSDPLALSLSTDRRGSVAANAAPNSGRRKSMAPNSNSGNTTSRVYSPQTALREPALSASMGSPLSARIRNASSRAEFVLEHNHNHNMTSFDEEGSLVPPPVGHIAIVLLEVNAYVKLRDELPEEMEVAMETYENVVTDVLTRFRGYLVRNRSEKMFIAFQNVEDACFFSMELHEQLVRQPWPVPIHDHGTTPTIVGLTHDNDDSEEAQANLGMTSEWALWRGLRICAAIHCGEPLYYFDPCTERVTYFGPVVYKAMRTLAAAFGGMTLITTEVLNYLSRLDRSIGDPVVQLHDKVKNPDTHEVEEVHTLLPRQFADRQSDFDARLKGRAETERREEAKRKLIEDESESDTELEIALGQQKVKRHEPMLDELYENSREMSRLPRGFVTFVVSELAGVQDLEASLTPYEMEDVRYRFADIVEERTQNNYGQVVTTEKDRLLSVFSRPSNALHFATSLQKSLMEMENLPSLIPAIPGFETEFWDGQEMFSGLRARVGIHATPSIVRLEPFTRQPVYNGEDIMLPAALAASAMSGQILLTDAVYYKAVMEILQDQQPAINCVGMQTIPVASISSTTMTTMRRLVVYQAFPRNLIGRVFLFHNLHDTRSHRATDKYRRLCNHLIQEQSMRWEEGATVNPIDNEEDDADYVSAAVARKGRLQGNLFVVLIGLLQRKDRYPGVLKQVETVETSLMALEDPMTYQTGITMSPTTELSIHDWESIFRAFTDLTGRKGNDNAGDGSSADWDLKENEDDEEDDDDDNGVDFGAMHFAAATRGAGRTFKSKDEEAAYYKDKCETLELEILCLHKDTRYLMSLAKQYIEPYFEAHKLSITEDDVISKTIWWHRNVRETVGGKKLAGSSSAAPAKPKRAAEEWRELLTVTLDKEQDEEIFASDPQKLMRSMLGHCCRFFSYIHKTMKRVQRERGKVR